uniref:Uncharacterized protein n=1 Tax=Arundo donax TaxID=35708 RepID=A0A0A8YR34_ARUDO
MRVDIRGTITIMNRQSQLFTCLVPSTKLFK